MRETVVEELFAEFERQAVSALQAPGVPAAAHRVRQRRRRRVALTAVAVLAVGAPAGALAVAAREGSPPAATPAAQPSVGDRTVVVVGAQGSLRDLRFVDARHGFALFDTCDREPFTDCRRTVGRTSDGGRTWQGVPLPATDGRGYLLARDARSVVVAAGEQYVVSADGGLTWTVHPVHSPPPAVERGSASPSGFRLTCPERDQECDRLQLARVGSDTVRQQPPLALDSDAMPQLVEGGDGRLWVATMKDGLASVAVSQDQAATWRALPPVSAFARLAVSPDGFDAWLVGGPESGPVWQLAGTRWERRPGAPPDTTTFAAVGHGILFVTGLHGTAGFWVDGRYLDRPELRAALSARSSNEVTAEALRDGTIVVQIGPTWLVGAGSGADRTWTRFS